MKTHSPRKGCCFTQRTRPRPSRQADCPQEKVKHSDFENSVPRAPLILTDELPLLSCYCFTSSRCCFSTPGCATLALARFYCSAFARRLVMSPSLSLHDSSGSRPRCQVADFSIQIRSAEYKFESSSVVGSDCFYCRQMFFGGVSWLHGCMKR